MINLSKYQLALIRTTYGTGLIFPKTGKVRLVHEDHAGGTADTQITAMVYGTISGDDITILYCTYCLHNPSGNHSHIYQLQIYEIRGIDPIVSDYLKTGSTG